MRQLTFIAICLAFLPAQSTAQNHGLKVPPGFEIVEFANEKLANDIHCMTIDPLGRVVVSGRGYLRILVDDNGDGKADRAIELAHAPKDGAMGLLWEGDALFVTGDGGLRRLLIKNDKTAGPSELIRALKTGGEHTTHAIRRGPDGWLYVLCGNTSGIDKSYAELPTSPIKEPIAGCVLRFSPKPRHEMAGVGPCEIVAHGFRNPYGMDFNLQGDLFTYDSDNERCVSLPWYEPTRLYHVIEGRHYGWLSPQGAAFWRRPPYFCDVVAPIATLGRGSPTGVACYRHNQFPPDYQGGIFLADWTFGKIHFASLKRDGASYSATTRVFLEAQGENGFAPTAIAVDDKSGDLYVSIGGRGTRGAVYRVRHLERFKAMRGNLAPLTMAKRSLEWSKEIEKTLEGRLFSQKPPQRLIDMQLLRRHLATEPSAAPLFRIGVLINWQHPDMHIRRSAADLVDDLGRGRFPKIENPIKGQPNAAMSVTLGLGAAGDRKIALERGLFNLRWSLRTDERLPGIRLVQIGLGDLGARNTIGTIWEGYTARQPIDDKTAAPALAKQFPGKDADVDRELARTLAMLGPDDVALRARMLGKCGADNPIDDIHYLACYARLGGQRDAKETKIVAGLLLDLDARFTARKLHRDSNWAPRVRELYVGLAEKDARLHRLVLEHPDFGRAEHALFANVEGFPREKASRIFLQRWQREKDYALNGNIVQLFHALPVDDVLPTIRNRWGTTGQEAALLPLLAKKPITADYKRFVAGLNSPQANVLLACLDGLDTLNAKSEGDEAFALVRALHRLHDKKPKPAPYGVRLAARLEKITGQKLGIDSQRWIAWLEKAHPELGKRLANPDGVDVAKWDARLAKLDWSTGIAERGLALYAKAGCVQCHSGSQALGPDLVGVTKRFSRADLFTAILQPSKDVPARYQTTLVETKAGKTHQGIVIYDAVDSLMLQTGASQTVRLNGADVVSRQRTAQSLMPAGLLDALSDPEIADLYAYLRSLGK